MHRYVERARKDYEIHRRTRAGSRREQQSRGGCIDQIPKGGIRRYPRAFRRWGTDRKRQRDTHRVLGHDYNLNDAYISLDLISKIRRLGAAR